MVIRFHNLMIKELKNNSFSLYINNKKNGTLFFNNNEIKITLNDFSYESIFYRLFANFLFKNNTKSFIYKNEEITPEKFYFLNKYKIILSDIDDTILSFKKAEEYSLTNALAKFNFKANKNILNDYSIINKRYWEMVEKKQITREECLTMRFDEFLPKYNIKANSFEFEEEYRNGLNSSAYMITNSRKVIDILSKKFDLYAITNGVKNTQLLRINKAKIAKYFKALFISEEVGVNKPDIKFFNYVEKYIKDLDKSKTIIIGDSLTSDIKLGNNANVDTIFFNYNKTLDYRNISFTYQINYIEELLILSNNY